jgi:uncharacterized glyoxalase superfamily protein PhnB
MSNIHYIPEGFHTVTPYFVVPDGKVFMEFLKNGLGAEEISIFRSPDGRIMHAQTRLGDSMLEFGEASQQYPAMKLCLHVYVPDADAAFRRATAAGARTLRDPRTEAYGERSAGIEDPAGNVWWIATRVEDVSEEEINRRMAAAKG